jgi:hypothetical protein
MVAYEFYRPDPVKGDQLLGILPERRKDPERITQKSIMGWAEKLFGDDVSTKGIYFIPVTINGDAGKMFGCASFHPTCQAAKK